jgi:peptidoglycan hydrolase-like protein with peptidoglycan-binding domain
MLAGTSSKRLALYGLAAAIGLVAPSESSANPNPRTQWIWYDGQTGHAVTCVQEVLAYCTGHQMPMDGVYGPITRAAVYDLQRFFNLVQDGVVGPETGEALKYVGEHCVFPMVGLFDYWNYRGCQPVVPTKT